GLSAGWHNGEGSGVTTREQILPIGLTQDELRERPRTEDRALLDLFFCYLGNPVAANGECFGADELFGRSVFAGFDRKRLDRLYRLALAEWRQNERRA